VTRLGLGDKVEQARTSFDTALDSVRMIQCESLPCKSAKKLHDVQADEVEVKFELKAKGEFGNNMFAVAKAGIEANYEVTLKWE
jgi:hypothetical protein